MAGQGAEVAAAAEGDLPLPLGIAFLVQHGFAANDLCRAQTIALAIEAPVAEVVIRHGIVTEEAYYLALADELGATFVADPKLGPLTDFPVSILSGLAPLASGSTRLVRAPRGDAVNELLEAPATGEPRFAITTPSILQRAVLRTKARSIARHASEQLSERDALWSYRDEIGIAQIVAASLVTGLVCAGALQAWSATLSVLGLVLGVLFLGMVVLRLAAVIDNPAVSDGRPPPRLPDAALPVYTVIVALHREGRVVAQLLDALRRLDYPFAKTDVKIVLEAGDRETLQALRQASVPAHIEVLIAPPGLPKTKPRALNVALPLARGEFTVIYDADDLPDPRQLRWAVAAFKRTDERVACLQARLRIYNADRNWLASLFALDYAALFDVINPGLLAAGYPIPLGGTSNHFRTAILRDVYGWDAWNVTEDADLGVRLARMGYSIGDLPSFTAEEAPVALGAWIKQRTRWMKGFMQTSLTHTRQPWRTARELGFLNGFALFAMTFGSVLSALGYPAFIALVVAGFADGTLLRPTGLLQTLFSAVSLVLLVAGLFAILLPGLVAVRRRRLRSLLPYVPALPLYYALISIAAWRGLWELLVDPFRWNKTDHNPAQEEQPNLRKAPTSTKPAPTGRDR